MLTCSSSRWPSIGVSLNETMAMRRAQWSTIWEPAYWCVHTPHFVEDTKAAIEHVATCRLSLSFLGVQH